MESISNTCLCSCNLVCYCIYPNIFISWSTCASLRCMLQSNPKITVFHHDNIFIWYRLTSKCGGIDIARLLDLCWIFYYWLQYMIGGRNLALLVSMGVCFFFNFWMHAGEGVGVSVAAFLKVTVYEVEYCACSHLQRPISFESTGKHTAEEFKVLTDRHTGILFMWNWKIDISLE